MRLGDKVGELLLYLILRELQDISEVAGDAKLVSGEPLEDTQQGQTERLNLWLQGPSPNSLSSFDSLPSARVSGTLAWCVTWDWPHLA